MRVILGLLLFATACGVPVLNNVPRPEPANVALIAAIVSTAITLKHADRHEANVARAVREHDLMVIEGGKPMHVTESVPADVLDRLDAATR